MNSCQSPVENGRTLPPSMRQRPCRADGLPQVAAGMDGMQGDSRVRLEGLVASVSMQRRRWRSVFGETSDVCRQLDSSVFTGTTIRRVGCRRRAVGDQVGLRRRHVLTGAATAVTAAMLDISGTPAAAAPDGVVGSGAQPRSAPDPEPVPISAGYDNNGIGMAAGDADLDGSGYGFPAIDLPSGRIRV